MTLRVCGSRRTHPPNHLSFLLLPLVFIKFPLLFFCSLREKTCKERHSVKQGFFDQSKNSYVTGKVAQETVTMLGENSPIIKVPSFHIKLRMVNSVKAMNQKWRFSASDTEVPMEQRCKDKKERLLVSPQTEVVMNDRNSDGIPEEIATAWEVFKLAADSLLGTCKAPNYRQLRKCPKPAGRWVQHVTENTLHSLSFRQTSEKPSTSIIKKFIMKWNLTLPPGSWREAAHTQQEIRWKDVLNIININLYLLFTVRRDILN